MAESTLLSRPFLERLERLTLHWQKSFSGVVGGHAPSRYAGAGQEFLDHRNFAQGDDLRNVNWRMFLRLERMFSKVFHLEPRIPMRLLLDVSSSMGTNGARKLEFAKQIAAALCYVGLVRLDTLTLHTFREQLHESTKASGGRHRYRVAEEYLQGLRAEGSTDFKAVARDFLNQYDRKGLLIIISDFLSEEDSAAPMRYLAEYGHELFLIQVWDPQDRVPDALGELELIDAESGTKLQLQFDEAAREEYTAAFDAHATDLRHLAERQGGRYFGWSTDTSLEDVFVDAMLRARGAA